MTQQLERTAFHESGHAVAFAALGIRVERVTIERSAGFAGRTVPALGIESGDPLHHAIAALAGPEATRQWNPTRLDWRDEQDFLAAEAAIDRAAGEWRSFPSIGAYASRRAMIALDVRAAAEQLVERHWTEIQTIANALLVWQTLEGEALARIFARSLAAR